MSDGQPLSDAVIAAIQQGRKIEAIKLLREETGLGLKEAKHAVEAYERGHPTSAPLAQPRTESSWGRLGLIALLVASAVAVYRSFS